jgi:hypothetical protein
VFYLLLVLHAFVGIGGMAGGLAAIIEPQAPMGISVDILKFSPFNNFLIPGILLFGVIGLGNVFSALSMFLKFKYQAYISTVFSIALVIWIFVQCIMLQSIAYLHVIFFIIGLIQTFLSAIILFYEHLFPSNIILRIFKMLEKKFPDNFILKNIAKLERYLSNKN